MLGMGHASPFFLDIPYWKPVWRFVTMVLTIEAIKQLRQETSAGVMDCRQALEQSNGDVDRALALLRQKGLEKAAKRSDQPVSQGVVETYSHGGGRIGVMVEINAETDFAARSETFHAFSHEIALQIAAAAPLYVSEEDIPPDVIAEEARQAAGRARQAGKPEAILPRIVEGQLRKFRDQNVLLRQAYIRDEKITIGQLLGQAIARVGENIVIRRFVRWELGPGDPPAQ
jgi:elongation factor Ts